MLVYHVQVRVQTSSKTLTDLLSGPFHCICNLCF